jgi:hypothetical protein
MCQANAKHNNEQKENKMTITNAIGETFNLATMTGWEVKNLAKILRAEITLYPRRRSELSDKLAEVDDVIRTKNY